MYIVQSSKPTYVKIADFLHGYVGYFPTILLTAESYLTLPCHQPSLFLSEKVDCGMNNEENGHFNSIHPSVYGMTMDVENLEVHIAILGRK